MTSSSRPARSGKDTRTPSLSMVAERAGVSIATVSRIINDIPNKASAETVKRVREAIAELGYRPSSAGQALRRKESRIVGVLAAALANPLMAAIAASIEFALREKNLVMVLCDTHESSTIQDDNLREMLALQTRAIVIVSAVDSKELDKLREAGQTLLFVNRPDPGWAGSPYVGIDNYQAGADVADLLLARGVKRFTLLHASLDRTAAYWRHKGFLDRLAASGISEDEVWHATAQGVNHLEIGYHAMKSLLDRTDVPRMVVCLSDTIAYGAYRCVREAGFSVPEDFAFFGFDDNPLNEWLADWLNSIGVPASDYGPAVLNALQTLWEGKPFTVPVYLPHRITIRNDCFPGD